MRLQMLILAGNVAANAYHHRTTFKIAKVYYHSNVNSGIGFRQKLAILSIKIVGAPIRSVYMLVSGSKDGDARKLVHATRTVRAESDINAP